MSDGRRLLNVVVPEADAPWRHFDREEAARLLPPGCRLLDFHWDGPRRRYLAQVWHQGLPPLSDRETPPPSSWRAFVDWCADWARRQQKAAATPPPLFRTFEVAWQ